MNIFLIIWLLGGIINFLLFLLGASFSGSKEKGSMWQDLLISLLLMLICFSLSWIIFSSCLEFSIEEYKKSKEEK